MFRVCCLFQRRAGLSCGEEGPHVNLPIAWTELSQLAQCKGKIQEGTVVIELVI